MRIKALVGPILLGLVSIAHAQVVPSDNAPGATTPWRDLSGTYASTWGAMTLHQNGNHVIGSYTFDGGQIDGTFDGTTLRFSWREEGGSAGFGVFVVGSDGRLDGSWGINDDHSSGAWTATLGSSTDLSDGLAASPFGDSKLHAGSWPVEVYMPWDGTFADDNVWIGMVGVGIGLGNRITPNWYLGVTADYEMLMGAQGGNWDAPVSVPDLNRLRGGIETRYIFNQGSGVGTVNDGPEFGVPRYDWIGARAGLETLDGGTTHGEYGELSIGSAFGLGRMQLGMYVAAGLSVEPVQAYGVTSPTSDTTGTTGLANMTSLDSSPSAIGTYVTLGMIVSLD